MYWALTYSGVVTEALNKCVKVDHSKGHEEVTFNYRHLHPHYNFVLEEEEEEEEEGATPAETQPINRCGYVTSILCIKNLHSCYQM